MAESIGAAGGGLPNLNLTAEEKRAYGQLFKEADPDGFGAVSGDVAVRFFEKTRLQPEVLGQIWQIADTENRGFLTPAGFGVVLRLIGHAQAGRTPSVTQATQPAPLPRFDGNIAAAMSPQTTGVPSSPTQGGPPVRVPALGPDKVAEYSALFEKSGAENGMLSGLVAKQIFERAKLPNDVLGRIWGLADTQGRGSLDTTEFVIAMHLLASYKAGAMRGVPNTLPPALYEAASRRVPPRMGGSYSSPAGGPPGGIYAQSTGFSQRPQSPITRQTAGTPLSSQTTGNWLISSVDKARFDQAFANVDTQGLGFITGEQAVAFFGNARLPEDVLAQIWDLSDINSEGRLDKDEFAVAMYLIRQQRGSRDGRGVLPAVLPPALIPPSKRKQAFAPSQPTAPAFENAIATQPRSAADDLFGLDVLAQPAPPQARQSTGDTEAGPFGNPSSPIAQPGVLPSLATNTASSVFKPFEPSSSFGRSLGPPATASPIPGQSRGFPATIPENEDLLGDADPTVSSKLTNETSELGNLSNQVGNLSKQMTELQGNRAQAEQELSQTNHQKRAFEVRLAQLRSAYEKEVSEYKTLQEQLTASRNETKRLQQEMAIIEGSHTDLGNQHQQLRVAFEADQQENISLKEKIRQLNAENDQLKPQIEKLKGDARQQKGMVAINKKQLATNEAERDRLKADLAAAQKEIDDAKKELEESARQVEVSKADIEKTKQAVPVAPAVRSPPAMPSPAASVSSNPFMRRTGTETTFSPPAASPEPVRDNRDTFDSLFGPSFAADTSAVAAPPPTTFRSETPTSKSTDAGGTVTPQVVEPPAPPSSRQITSEALPFRSNLERADSLGSSVQVAPPASRHSPADTPRAMTPTTVSSIGEHAQHSKDPFETAKPDEEQESVRSAVEATTPAVDIPGAFPGAETPRTSTPPQSFNKAAIAAGAGIGAVALATGAGLAAVSTTEDKGEPSEGIKSEDNKKQANNFDEYFGGPAHQRTPSEQVKDFDAAFASMKAPGTQTASNQANPEFPDIQEIEDDDDSSSDEEAPLGFDDDFSSKTNPSLTSAGMNKAAEPEPTSNATGKQPEVASALPGHLQVRPGLETASSTASSLPDIERETSPPNYNDAVPENNPSHFPREYKGLLPEREDPTSPPASGSAHPPPPPAGTPPAYGPEVTKPQDTVKNVESQAAKPATAQPGAFDFDSAFSGMGPAQVEDDDSDEADATFGSNRDHTGEFDPSFDSPAQSRTATVASLANSPAVHRAVTNGTTSAAQPSVTDSFYNFGNGTTAQEAEQKTSTAPVSHDWDALFAPLSNPTAPIGTETDAPPPPPSSLKPERPQPGRALSTGTEHDDPILKRLTSMGWSRSESLAALEKFDYNIDKAADYLTFRT